MSAATVGPTSPANFLKVREDPEPLSFDMDGSKVVLASGNPPAWAAISDLDRSHLRSRIEPWLTSLFQADHLNLLIGSGLTRGVQGLAGADIPAVMAGGRFAVLGDEIAAAAAKSASAAGRSSPNIEDEIRTAAQLARGLEILDDARASSLRLELGTVLKEFANAILAGERALAVAEEVPRKTAFMTLVSFLMSFASRTGTRDRLGLFTTNYDRVIEMGADLAGIHLVDRFVGTVSPIFRSSRLDLDLHYNPPGIRGEPRFVEGVARFTKLHGSLDWVETDSLIRRAGIPFGAADVTPFLDAPTFASADPARLMVYPNASKDRETAEYPYVDLFRDFAAAVARPNSVTVTFGYSFGDEHINRVIKDALTIPSTHLVVMAYGDELGRIKNAFESWGHEAQISLMIGPELSDIASITSNYLPKPSIDLASRRMGELLRQRVGGVGSAHGTTSPTAPGAGLP